MVGLKRQSFNYMEHFCGDFNQSIVEKLQGTIIVDALLAKLFCCLVFVFDVLPQLALVVGLPDVVSKGIKPSLELKKIVNDYILLLMEHIYDAYPNSSNADGQSKGGCPLEESAVKCRKGSHVYRCQDF